MSRARLKSMDPDGKDRRIQRALAVNEDFDRFLTNVLVGNNIVNIASFTITTFIMTELFGALVGLIWVIVLMVTVMLVIGEITPKSLAKRNAEHFAIRVLGVVRVMIAILSPIMWVFLLFTRGVTKLPGQEGKEEAPITENELVVMINKVQRAPSKRASSTSLSRLWSSMTKRWKRPALPGWTSPSSAFPRT